MIFRRNVLIFHQAALGDFIVTWPLALGLARLYPQHRVIYVTAASKGELAGRVIGVESVDVEQGWHQLYSDESQLPEVSLKRLQAASTIISFVSSADDEWEKNVRKISPEATLVRLRTKPVDDAPVNDDQLPAQLQNHITAVLVKQLDLMPIVQSGVRSMLRTVVDRGLPNRAPSLGAVVIHPGAGKSEKCWAVDRFIQLAERLEKAGWNVHVLIGEAELDSWTTEAITRISNFADVRRPATYVDLLGEIESAGVFVGNDSGPGHLAGIIGVPTVGLFGTSPDRWKPIGPRMEIVRGNSMDDISVDEVFKRCQSITLRDSAAKRTAKDDED